MPSKAIRQPLLWEDEPLAMVEPIAQPPVSSPPVTESPPRLMKLASEVHARYASYFPGLALKLVAKPLISISGRLVRKPGHLVLRLCDLLDQAPEAAAEALVECLYRQLAGRKVPKGSLVSFWQFARRPEVEAILQARRANWNATHVSNREIANAVGFYHDLAAILEKVIQSYFHGEFLRPQISWSRHRARSRWASCNLERNSVLVNPCLDRKTVPRSVIEFLVYHECLHLRHGAKPATNGRRSFHDQAFRADEQAHPSYQEAVHFLRGFSLKTRL